MEVNWKIQKSDKEIVLEAVKQDGSALRHTDANFRYDKEIVLTGIHLGSYGSDVRRTVSLIDVLEAVSPIDGIERIRIGSLEPMDFSLEMVDSLARFPKLMPHFHLPLQLSHVK